MRCPVHCPPARSVLPRAVAVLVMAALSSLAYAAVASVAEAVALTVLGLCVPASWVTWRMVRYGSLRKPAVFKVQAQSLNSAPVNARQLARRARLVRAPYQLPAPPLMIEAPVAVATALARERERIGP